jgi:HEAT repeat protein
MVRQDGKTWISNQPKALKTALKLLSGEAGNLFQNPSLASLWREGAKHPGGITLFLRPLGVRKTLLGAPLGAGLRRILKSPLGKKVAILLQKRIQDSHEEWTILGTTQNLSESTPIEELTSPKSIPQIEGRSWFWAAKSWDQAIKNPSEWGPTPAPLPLLPELAETLRGALGDKERKEWASSLGQEILWFGPLPEQKGGGILIPIQNPQSIEKALRTAGARDFQGTKGLSETPKARLLWEGGKGKLQIEILETHILLSTPGFNLEGLDLVGNSQDLPKDTLLVGSLSGRELGIPNLPNSIEFQARRTSSGATQILFQNTGGTQPFWASLTKALGKHLATSKPTLATQEDPELLEAILGTLRLETEPVKAQAAIAKAQKTQDLESLRMYATSDTTSIAARAIEALGTLKDKASAPLFHKAVAESQPASIRWAGAYGLFRLGTTKTRGLLRNLLLDSDAHVRLYALKALSAKSLNKKEQDTLVQLIDTWTKDETADRSQALLLLHDKGDPNSLDHLALTPAGGNRFQQALVYTFQDLSPKLPTRDEVIILRKAMRSRNLALQRYAIQRLGALGTQEAVATLREESKRLAGTPLAPAIRASLEANSAGPGIGAMFRSAKAKIQFWFRSSVSWLRRQNPATQKMIALSPVALLLLFGAFWGLRRRKRRIHAQVEIQELIRPSSEGKMDNSSYLDPEDAVQLEDEEEQLASSLYNRE